MSEEEVAKHIIGMDFLQPYNLKTCLNMFGGKGDKAVTKELAHLNNMESFIPMDSQKLTKQERVEALLSLMFL